MDMGFLLLPALLAFFAGGAIGCQSNSPEYSIGFRNDDPAMITASRVDWRIGGSDRHELIGRLAPGGRAESYSIQRPIPPTATVTWQTLTKRHIV
jgi:hypothetical protein